MRQFELRDGAAHLVTWLRDDKRLRLGARVSLKDSADPKRLWQIIRRGAIILDASRIHQDWRVGGLL